jgi:gamma-glutamylcyclotransferase (GGCT)/AIG2-like uncharacterized protein YtfP
MPGFFIAIQLQCWILAVPVLYSYETLIGGDVMDINRVFVYGTLMSGMRNHHLIKPYLKRIISGKTDGILYDLPYGYPAIIPGNSIVCGEIMELRDPGEALEVLDRLEDYHGKESYCNLYNRIIQVVETRDGERLPAYLYIWGRPNELGELGTIVQDGDWRVLINYKGGEKDMNKYYFAYGSCMDFEGRIKSSAFVDDFEMIGVGKLNDYRFLMNKRAADGINVFANIVRDQGRYVNGVLYQITERAEKEYLDVREGYNLHPRHYDKVYGSVHVDGKEYISVLFYMATPEFICPEVRPTTKKYEMELKKGGDMLPDSYRSEFLAEIEKCVDARLATNKKLSEYEQQASLYHDYGQETEFMESNQEFYELVREMTIYFGDFNERVTASGVTPEMFRVLVKLIEMAARGELDLDHRIPRGMLERLESEFRRIKG